MCADPERLFLFPSLDIESLVQFPAGLYQAVLTCKSLIRKLTNLCTLPSEWLSVLPSFFFFCFFLFLLSHYSTGYYWYCRVHSYALNIWDMFLCWKCFENKQTNKTSLPLWSLCGSSIGLDVSVLQPGFEVNISQAPSSMSLTIRRVLIFKFKKTVII